ncbi:MAG: Gfo/Idh/MocA family oxidoreductase [Phycisphaerales bacterium]|nr:Gfo/Idh/MocA family oxidoreductase [Phycisphaerales bacterium]
MNPTDRRTFLQHTAGTMAAISLLPALESMAAIQLEGPLRIAVVGTGRQGRAILAELQKFNGLEIVALCDSDESRLRSGLRRAQGAEGFATHAELLEKAPDLAAVFVATPTHLHRRIAEDCLAAGKHVYCEAPLAASVDDCQAIVRAARDTDTVFQTGLQSRSNPIYQLARTFVRTDAVRDLVSLRAQYHRKTTWRTPAPDPSQEQARNWRLNPDVSIGLAGEFGTHQFDAVNWFVNDYPVEVRGAGSIRLHNDGRKIADTVQCTLSYNKGLQLQYEATIANSFQGRFELFCGSMAAVKLSWTAGWMFKEADAPTQGWEVYAMRERFHSDDGITLIADATQLAAQGKLKEGIGLPNPPLYYAIEDFLRSVTQGKPVVCTAEEGLRAAVIGILANQAVITGDTITIDRSLFKAE